MSDGAGERLGNDLPHAHSRTSAAKIGACCCARRASLRARMRRRRGCALRV